MGPAAATRAWPTAPASISASWCVGGTVLQSLIAQNVRTRLRRALTAQIVTVLPQMVMSLVASLVLRYTDDIGAVLRIGALGTIAAAWLLWRWPH